MLAYIKVSDIPFTIFKLTISIYQTDYLDLSLPILIPNELYYIC